MHPPALQIAALISLFSIVCISAQDPAWNDEDEWSERVVQLADTACGSPSKVKEAMVFKLTLADSLLSQDLGAAAKQVLEEMLWNEISEQPSAQKVVGKVSSPTKVMFLDTECDGGLLRDNGFLMRARDASGTKDFTFKHRSDDEADIPNYCMAVNGANSFVKGHKLADTLKSKRQITAAPGGTSKTAYALYNSFKGPVMFDFATAQQGQPGAAWMGILPVLGSHLKGHSVIKVIRTAIQREVEVGGGVKVGGLKAGFSVITWETEDGDLVGGELTWGYNCKEEKKSKGKKAKGKKETKTKGKKKGKKLVELSAGVGDAFDSEACAHATAANEELFKKLQRKYGKMIASGSKTAALMKRGKCPEESTGAPTKSDSASKYGYGSTYGYGYSK